MNLAALPLTELRRRFVERTETPPPDLLASLAADPRQGARRLGVLLERRRVRAAAEERRLGRMLRFERALWAAGATRVAGVDEVGMGPLAGPVVAAAVVLPREPALAGLDDSKRLTIAVRERLDGVIRRHAVSVGVGWATPAEIDRLNIYRAGLLAMRRAVARLRPAPQFLLVDGRQLPVATPQRAIVRGDARSASVAAASVVAKVYRDAWMRELDRWYPGYGFARHMGYATAEHLGALERSGATPIHRRSFEPVRAARVAPATEP